ncbi:TonB-dependent receptor [Gracilimonas mengyeensis]|uniref:TonB-dependent receptor n=1 Tax=Gracilimonas mengyeensis TaxID=1302730 RepID=UPI00163D9C68|nr:TonB-dependent receptor [Gracilimonas mengyeensis]
MLLPFVGFAQSKGKITGSVTDESGEPLVGVQIILEGTSRGTITEPDGYYSLINVDPDIYTLVFKYIGFADVRVENVEVITDRTTEISTTMRESVIEGEEVIITAERPIVEKDRTTTTSYVSSKEIENLPVQSVGEVVNLQAGVVEGHFRGGRIGEVAYVVNGVPINNAYTNSAGFEIEQNMVSNLEVISGVFNAEYGQALSGVVNITTKDVPSDWTFNIKNYARAIASNRKLIFLDREGGPGSDLSYLDFTTEKVPYYEVAGIPNRLDLQLNAGGPIIPGKLGFQITGRYVDDKGTLFGKELFNPSDSSSYLQSSPPGGYTDPENPENDWIIESTGNGDYVPLSGGKRYSINGSLTYNLTGKTKLDYNAFLQNGESTYFAHDRKYVPDGRNTQYSYNQTHILSLRQAFSSKTFGNLSYSYLRSEAESKLYSDVLDDRLVRPRYGQQTGAYAFAIGGNDLGYGNDITQTHTIVGSLTSQINRVHQVKMGGQVRLHDVSSNSYGIIIDSSTGFEPEINPSRDPGTGFRDLDVNPVEFAAYIQDKIELDNIIINAGIRFDYFDPDFVVPKNYSLGGQEVIPDINNPADSVSNRKPASIKTQISPRVGIAFPISETGVVRFSYGLFFQTPSFNSIYLNPEYFVLEGSSVTSFGNPNIDPEQTSTFEIGLQQGLTEDIGLDLTLFTKDIRNLTATLIERNQATSGIVTRPENQDYGTVRGFTLSLSKRPVGAIRWNVDYTLQFADGSAFISGNSQLRREAGLDDITVLSRLGWDRRHVLNSVLTYVPNNKINITLVNRLNTGRPYTSERSGVRSYIPNNVNRPTTFLSDLRAYYTLPWQQAQLILQIENIFDSKAPQEVYADSGRPDFTRDEINARQGRLIGLNTYDDWFTRPEFLSAPRRITLGLSINF